MKRFVLLVELDIKPGHMDTVLRAARDDASGSVAHEPGCQRFDVLRDPAQPDRLWYYEVYDDEAAVVAHREMPHFKAYSAIVEPLIAGKRVLRLNAEETRK